MLASFSNVTKTMHTIFSQFVWGFATTETTDSEVRDLFAEFGTVELVSVPRNRETGQARGFAFVDMATREDLDKAISGVNGLMFGGRTIRVAESLPKNQVVKESTKKVAPGTFHSFIRVCVCVCVLHGMTKLQSGPHCTSSKEYLVFFDSISILHRGGSEENLRWQPFV